MKAPLKYVHHRIPASTSSFLLHVEDRRDDGSWAGLIHHVSRIRSVSLTCTVAHRTDGHLMIRSGHLVLELRSPSTIYMATSPSCNTTAPLSRKQTTFDDESRCLHLIWT
ncbi:uncharacterized protein BJ212DRAFT_1387606 [Suillus subaureus]|uniref:Uncharacterized protein n=1 Tax=Suillus subaureus TaxID=48587 RepID=A0A9P7J850_9AGAM|nr:uncharacterized protein BJ212DRAFT_1387606 [Suillus subaureus]KAG1807308.1 hypothetical protein BJ212DRAFT_1387606 [Suillus subaureus]